MAGADTGQIGINDDGSVFNMHNFQMRQLLGRVRTVMIAKVVKLNHGKDGQAGTVNVELLTNQMDGGGKPTDHGTVYERPYLRMQNGPHAIIMEPAVGDIGPLLIHDRDISSNLAKRGKANPASNRRFSPSDGTFMGGYLNKKATTTRTMSGNSIEDVASQQDKTGGHITHKAVGGDMNHSATKQNNQGGSITHTSDADMTHKAGGNIVRQATQTITDTATSISHSGNTSVTGTLGVSGLLSGLGGAVFGAASFAIDALGNLLATSFTSGVTTPAVGDVLYRGPTNWDILPPGPAGQVLTTEGAGLAPVWSPSGSGLTAIADGAVLSNISGSTAVPGGNQLSAVIDHDFGSTEGQILCRGVSAWQVLGPGTAGQVLTTGGPGALPSWAASGSGLTTIVDGDVLANISGSTALPVANTVTALLDHVFGSAQGDIIYRGSATWGVLTPGTAGQALTTGGAGSNPSWATPASSNYLGIFAFVSLPASPTTGSTAYCSNGRKVGEGAGAGTGVMTYFSSGWKTFSSDQPVSS